jgi:sortase (surface protein transpeptidase)
MWGFAWEPVIAAVVPAVLVLVGVVLTIRSQSNQTRKAGLEQHRDQDKKLDELLHAHKRLDRKIEENKEIAASGLSELSGQVAGVITTTDTLFNMIVDLDKRATKRGNSVTTRLKHMEESKQ